MAAAAVAALVALIVLLSVHATVGEDKHWQCPGEAVQGRSSDTVTFFVVGGAGADALHAAVIVQLRNLNRHRCVIQQPPGYAAPVRHPC